MEHEESTVEVTDPGQDNLQVSEFDDTIEPGQVQEQESEEEAQAVEPEEEPQDPYEDLQWDGDPNKLPKPLKRVHDEMMRGWGTKTAELARLRREYEQKLESASKPEPKQPEAPPPLDESSQDALERSLDARIQHLSAQGQSSLQQEIKELKDALQEIRGANTVREIVSDLQAKDGWSDDVFRQIQSYEQDDPQLWETMMMSPRGRDMLFRRAVDEMKKSEEIREAARRRASAPKRAVTAPGERGQAKKATPADRYAQAKDWDEIAAMTVKDLGG